jgi:hypothetical protein
MNAAASAAQRVLGVPRVRVGGRRAGASQQARAGAPKAIVVTARKLAERVYRLLKYGAEYVCQKIEVYEAAYRERVVKGLARKAAELGFRLEPAAATVP